MSVKQKYLEDEENNVFSPVTYMGEFINKIKEL